MKKLFILIIFIVSTLTLAQSGQNMLPPGANRRDNLKNQPKTPARLDQIVDRAFEKIVEKDIISQDVLENMEKENPAFYRRMLIKTWAELEKFDFLENKDPDLYESSKERIQLEIQTWQLAMEYRQSEDEAEKENIKAELREKLDTLFDLRELEKKRRIEKLEKELAKLKEAVQLRQEKKEDIISNRLNDMIGKKDELEW